MSTNLQEQTTRMERSPPGDLSRIASRQEAYGRLLPAVSDVYPNSPCPLLAHSKRVIINERNAIRTPRVVRVCQAPLDIEVDTPYLKYTAIAKKLGAWQMVGRKACGLCRCGECCPCVARRYEPKDAERAASRRAHMREFDARVRTDYQQMRIMYDKP